MMQFEVDVAEDPGMPRVVEATHPREAARMVIRDGKTPLAVRQRSPGWMTRLRQPLALGRALDGAMLALFAQQLSELLRAGVGIEGALSVLAQHEGGGTLAALNGRLLMRVREGLALSRALTLEPEMPGHLIGIVEGAEAAGVLQEGLAAAAESLAREAAIARRARAVLAYPALLLVVAMCSTAFILMGVIPEFEPLFAGEESRLPWVTQLVLLCSSMLTQHGVLMSLAVALPGVAGYALLSMRSRWRAAMMDRLARVPPVQYAVRLDAASALAVMGSLLQHGLDAPAALTHAAHASRLRIMRDALLRGAGRLREGISMSRVFADMSMLPATTRLLIEVGDNTGQAARAIVQAAQLLDADTQRRVDRLLGVLNPCAVILLGAVIAFLIAGLMLGILSINQLALK